MATRSEERQDLNRELEHCGMRGCGSADSADERLLDYAFTLLHDGRPRVYWQDYFAWGLGRPGQPNGIAAVVAVRAEYSGGRIVVLHDDGGLYIMARTGFGGMSGLIFVMNTREEGWNGARVVTQWKDTKFVPAAWNGRDNRMPVVQRTGEEGSGEFHAPPRGYVVYVPEA